MKIVIFISQRTKLKSISANLMTSAHGASNGWMSANFLALQKHDSSLPGGPLTMNEASFVLSIYFVGAMVGNFIAPVIVRRFGSKRVILCAAFPQMVSSSRYFRNDTHID